MHYLLIGNGDIDLNAFSEALNEADVIIQINKCRHIELTKGHSTSYIFLVNTGEDVSELVSHLLSLNNYPELKSTSIILARNILYYLLKLQLLKQLSRPSWVFYSTSSSYLKLANLWRVKSVSFLFSLLLDIRLFRLGMPPSSMPSTGLIAYMWLRKRLCKNDTLKVIGFTFEGWERHPWDIERKLLTTVDARTSLNAKEI